MFEKIKKAIQYVEAFIQIAKFAMQIVKQLG